MSRYVELQAVSNFSFLRGASHPEELIEQAAALGYQAFGLCDEHSLAGVVRAHTAAKRHKISLLVGARVTPRAKLPEPGAILAQPEELLLNPHLPVLLYATSARSYANLCQLLTRGKLRAPKGECYLTCADLLDFAEGLQAILPLNRATEEQALLTIRELQPTFPPRQLSLGISRLYGPRDDETISLALKLQEMFALPLVATNDVYYHRAERGMLQDVLSCIRLGCTIDTLGYHRFPNHERYIKSPEELARLFRAFPQALLRTQEIAEQAAQFSLDQLRYRYPREIYPANKTPLEYLEQESWLGAEKKFPQGVPSKVVALIRYELNLISELNYAEYFLTVYDIVNFARTRNILCQGRGAAANSAVCYSLGITAVDPSRVNMLFERFISKERDEPPDIDVDFEHERREEVIQYIYEKYGRERAALVAEVVCYRGRSAIREVGKALGLSLDCVDALAKSISHWSTKELTLQLLASGGLNIEDPLIINALELTQTIVGFPRHLSQHVGGFIISESPLTEIVPIENAAMIDRTVIEWDKDDIEALGMLKIDILALGILTCIRKSLGLLNALQPSASKAASKTADWQLHSIPAEDSAVYDMICAADTVGVFQIESRAQMSMLPRLKPRSYYDLVIEVAIVRPGPIQGNMVHPYLRRRSGLEPASYPDEQIKSILSRTLGVPLFQEQAMQLAIVGAGFTPGEADQLRRAIAGWKRKGNQLAVFGQRIIAGMLARGYSRQFGESCFEQIKGFSGYGFPESHAASFALLVYVSAWLKKHHPAAFTASLLNSQPMGFYLPAQLIRDAREHGVNVHPIDVNCSRWDCTLEPDPSSISGQSLRLGLRLVKSLRHEAAEKIQQCITQRGPFSSITDLWRSTALRTSTLRALAFADAFTSLGLTRQTALWQISKLKDTHLPLFDRLETDEPAINLPAIPKQLQVLQDYAHTGLSLKAHPMSFLRDSLSRHGVTTADQLRNRTSLPSGSRVALAGLVLVRQKPSTASGIVFVTIEDESGAANLIVRPQVYEQYKKEIRQSVMILVRGSIERAEGVVHVIVKEVVDLSSSFSGLVSGSRDFH